MGNEVQDFKYGKILPMLAQNLAGLEVAMLCNIDKTNLKVSNPASKREVRRREMPLWHLFS